MAFTHGKKTRLWVDGYELTSFFNEFNMAAKAGVAETTVFGVGAKTFIGGLKEGQITAKGFFGAAVKDVEDSELSAALGRQGNMCITVAPSGSSALGARGIVAYAAETDYSITAPVAGVVSTQMTGQADSGLSTGVFLDDPTSAAITTAGTTNGTGYNDIAATSSTVNDPINTTASAIQNIGTGAFTTGSGVLTTVGNPITLGFSSTGGVIGVGTGSGQVAMSYTGLTSGSFTGCLTLNSGTGSTAVGSVIEAPQLTTGGLVAIMNLLALTDNSGTGPTVTVTIQQSDDNSTWVQLAEFGPGQGSAIVYSAGTFGAATFGAGGGAITGGITGTSTFQGGYAAVVAFGTPISRYLRVVTTTAFGTGPTGTLMNCVLGVAIARQ